MPQMWLDAKGMSIICSLFEDEKKNKTPKLDSDKGFGLSLIDDHGNWKMSFPLINFSASFQSLFFFCITYHFHIKIHPQYIKKLFPIGTNFTKILRKI